MGGGRINLAALLTTVWILGYFKYATSIEIRQKIKQKQHRNQVISHQVSLRESSRRVTSLYKILTVLIVGWTTSIIYSASFTPLATVLVSPQLSASSEPFFEALKSSKDQFTYTARYQTARPALAESGPVAFLLDWFALRENSNQRCDEACLSVNCRENTEKKIKNREQKVIFFEN